MTPHAPRRRASSGAPTPTPERLPMVNHPRRGHLAPPGAAPTAAQVLHARQAAGLTQAQAARLVYVAERTWQAWEGGTRTMPPAAYELALAKAGVRPLPQPPAG